MCTFGPEALTLHGGEPGSLGGVGVWGRGLQLGLWGLFGRRRPMGVVPGLARPLMAVGGAVDLWSPGGASPSALVDFPCSLK